MPVNASDLPAHVRARLKAEASPASSRRTTQQVAKGKGTTWRCASCPELEPFTAWAPAQRHADSHDGGRLEVVL